MEIIGNEIEINKALTSKIYAATKYLIEPAESSERRVRAMVRIPAEDDKPLEKNCSADNPSGKSTAVWLNKMHLDSRYVTVSGDRTDMMADKRVGELEAIADHAVHNTTATAALLRKTNTTCSGRDTYYSGDVPEVVEQDDEERQNHP